MNIVFSSSDSYSELAGISIVSICENNKNVDTIDFFVIDNGISDLNKERLNNTVKKYNRSIKFVDKVDLNKLTNSDVYTGRWNIGTFFRLYLSSILPQSVEKVMYVDCDMIVRSSLEEVYNMDMEGAYVMGVDDCRSDLYRLDIGCKPGDLYINNGFMVIDLKKWRESNLEEKFTQFISKRNGDCTYMDQAPLNGTLVPINGIKELPAKYNAQRIFFDFSYKQLLKLRKPEKHLSLEEFNEARENPVIVHFTPVFISGTRPWQKKDKHPFRGEYLHYKSISEWKDVPLRKDDRKFAKKVMTVICKITPRPLMIWVMSYLHAKWYPKKRIQIAKKIEKEAK